MCKNKQEYIALLKEINKYQVHNETFLENSVFLLIYSHIEFDFYTTLYTMISFK